MPFGICRGCVAKNDDRHQCGCSMGEAMKRRSRASGEPVSTHRRKKVTAKRGSATAPTYSTNIPVGRRPTAIHLCHPEVRTPEHPLPQSKVGDPFALSSSLADVAARSQRVIVDFLTHNRFGDNIRHRYFR